MAPIIGEINDPLSTMGDPEGFPRNLLFELRPFQVVHTPNQVLMLYMFEKRWRDDLDRRPRSCPRIRTRDGTATRSAGGRTTPRSS